MRNLQRFSSLTRNLLTPLNKKLKKMTKKVQFETCPDAQFQEIKEAKQRLEDSAAFLLTMGE